MLATPAYLNSFEGAVNFISAFAEAKESMTARARKIGSASRDNGGRGGRRGRGGRGRGRGRGRFGGRGGRGAGGRGTAPSGHFDASQPARTYSGQEWRELSKSEFSQVLAARDASNKRKAAAVDTEDQEDIAGIGNQLGQPGQKRSRRG